MTIADYIFRSLAAIAACWPIALYILNRWKKEESAKIMAATTGAVQDLIAKGLEKCISGRDPKSYYTLDIRFPSGAEMKVPMIPGLPVAVLENIEITVTSHTLTETIATFVCKGFGHLDSHSHPVHDERIEVISGFMTDLDTGRIYRAGEIWDIPMGTFHRATFENAVMILRYKPPLKTAKDRPVDIEAMKQIFP